MLKLDDVTFLRYRFSQKRRLLQRIGESVYKRQRSLVLCKELTGHRHRTS